MGTPAEEPRESAEKMLLGRDSFSDPLAATRLFCGALILPTASMLVGRYLFKRLSSNMHRTLLGGLTFILAKGIVRIYLRQQQYIRHTRRTVCDYEQPSDPKLEIADDDHKLALLDALDVVADEENLENDQEIFDNEEPIVIAPHH